MPILDEDGRPLRQPGPNPLLVNQERDGKWLMLNPTFEEVSIEYGRDDSPPPRFLELVEEEPEEPKPKPRPREERPREEPQPDRVLCHALPAVANEDELYGDSTTKYLDPITLEVYVVQDGDMIWRAWTNVALGPDSILYVPSAKRWWRVVQSQPWRGGQLLDCLPSERKPDFQAGVA